jgi:arylsulfatase
MGDIISKYYNNKLENIGEPDSFVWYGMYLERPRC